MESLKDMWQLVREKLKESCGEVIYDIWIKPLEIIYFDGARAEIAASEFVKKIIEQKFHNELKDAFKSVMGFDVDVVLIDPDKAQTAQTQPERNKAPSVTSTSIETNTFETFVVGSSNRFAHAAAQAVAATPGSAYNPLFIYGNSGLGKTHLLCAISNEVKRNNPDADIIFTRGEDFVTLIVEGIKEKKMKEIHEKYRNCDVLLVDDIQFIAGKESTQEEFFHTFNALTQDNKQIVLTSDRAPKDIEILDERLRNRFEWGLIADIQPPDIETRMAIIQRKASTLGLELPQDVVQYVAEKIKTNIRQLEGAVKNIKANSLIYENKPITIMMAQTAIRDILNDNQPIPVTISKIINEVGRTFNISEQDIKSNKRAANISRARQVAMYVIKDITQMSMAAIGEEFGGRDHSTVVYAISQTEKMMKTDSHLREIIEDITKNIKDM